MRKASNAILWDAQQKRKFTDIGCVMFPTLTAEKSRQLSEGAFTLPAARGRTP